MQKYIGLAQPYGIAALATLGTVALRWMLEGVLQGQASMLLFTLAVFISAHVGGLGPGLLATLFSAVCAVDHGPARGRHATSAVG